MLINNHEISGSETFKVPPLPGLTYANDPKAGGGTTTIEVDKDGNRIREYVSLAGTHNNCAGGRTPWETWLTWEETVSAPTGSTVRHGYVFEVDPTYLVASFARGGLSTWWRRSRAVGYRGRQRRRP